MTSSWYVKDELPFRMAVWHGAQTLSNVFGGPLAAGILETMDGLGGLHAWKWCKSDVTVTDVRIRSLTC